MKRQSSWRSEPMALKANLVGDNEKWWRFLFGVFEDRSCEMRIFAESNAIMNTKQEIVENWLPRYTGLALDGFGEYILLTNFQNYVDNFAEWQGVEVVGRDKPKRG